MAQQTTALGVPYYQSTDSPAGYSQQQALADFLDANPGVGSFTQTQINAFTTAQKRAGRIVFNQTAQKPQMSNGSTWDDIVLGSDARLADQRTPSDGSVTTAKVSDGAITNAKLQNASVTINGTTVALGGSGTVEAGATGGGTDKAFYLNDQAVTASYSIPSGKNAVTAGPVTVNSGVTVTVPSGSAWAVI